MKELNTVQSLIITILIIIATSLISINSREVDSTIITIEKGMSLNSVSKLLLDENNQALKAIYISKVHYQITHNYNENSKTKQKIIFSFIGPGKLDSFIIIVIHIWKVSSDNR